MRLKVQFDTDWYTMGLGFAWDRAAGELGILIGPWQWVIMGG